MIYELHVRTFTRPGTWSAAESELAELARLGVTMDRRIPSRWRWSSEDPGYNGAGTRDLWPDGGWSVPGESAIVLAPGRQQVAEESQQPELGSEN